MTKLKIFVVLCLIGALCACDGRSRTSDFGISIEDKRLAQCVDKALRSIYVETLEDVKHLRCHAPAIISDYHKVIPHKPLGPGERRPLPVKSIAGLEKLTHLETLDLSHNLIEEIDLSPFKHLHSAYLRNNLIKEVDLSQNANLETLDISNNPLEYIAIGNSSSLQHLDLSAGHDFEDDTVFTFGYAELAGFQLEDFFAGVSLTGSDALVNVETFKARNRKSLITDFSKLTNLKLLDVRNSDYKHLDLSGNSGIKDIDASNNPLESINFHDNANVLELKINECQFSDLPSSLFQKIKSIKADNNNLTMLDMVNSDYRIERLSVANNNISDVNIVEQYSLDTLNLSGNQISEIDISTAYGLQWLDISQNPEMSDLSLGPNTNALRARIELHAKDNNFSSMSLTDPARFKILNLSNSLKVRELDFSEFTNLYSLNISHNPSVTAVTLPETNDLQYLNVDYCQVSELNISHLNNLQTLNAEGNQLASLDISNNPNLSGISLENNRLATLDISNNIYLDYLHLDNNNLTHLNTVEFISLDGFRVVMSDGTSFLLLWQGLLLTLCGNPDFEDAELDKLTKLFYQVLLPSHLPQANGGCSAL